MRQRACTDLSGGRSAMVVLNGTVGHSASTWRLTGYQRKCLMPGRPRRPVSGGWPAG